MQIFVKIIKTRSDEDQKTTTLGGILVEGIHNTPGKRLAGDDCNATARPLPGPRQGPCQGHERGHCQASQDSTNRPQAAASSTSWAGTCMATGGLYTNSASTCVVACRSS